MPGEWAISYPGTDLVFGDASGIHLSTHPELGPVNRTVDDADLPRTDGVVMGVDYVGGQAIGLSFGIDGKTEADVRAKYGLLTSVWDAPTVRGKAGALAELVSDTGRRAYGRPRRFAPTAFDLWSSYIRAVADFETVDRHWYGPVDHEASVSIVPPAGGGLVAPLASPLTTTRSSDRSTVLEVGGEVPTWPVFTVQGPITNPVVEIVGLLRLEFNLTLAYDQSLVIDTRPGRRTILRGTGSVAGALRRTSTRLVNASVPPGRYELVLRGTSAPGTSRVSMRWRDAFPNP